MNKPGKRQGLALGGSILVHIGVVVIVGASLISPPRIVNRIEVDLEGAKGSTRAAGIQAPVSSQAPALPLPDTAALPSSSTVPPTAN